MSLWNDIKQGIEDTLMPRRCAVCGCVLGANEKYLCMRCDLELPKTGLHLKKFNKVEQLFAGKVPIERATGYFYYNKESKYANVIRSVKYRNQPRMAYWLASRFAKEVSGYFADVDCVIPIPVHTHKEVVRGYNQSAFIAQGIADVLGVPMYVDVLVASSGHKTQTHKSVHERWLNTVGIFKVEDAELIKGKHILVVDDVVTTGATLTSCALELRKVEGVKVSIATLGVDVLL